jgi:DNA-directed RNA polymerase specialized sigma subunit
MKTSTSTPASAFTPNQPQVSSASLKDQDMEAWRKYKQTKSTQDRNALLSRFSGAINSQVNKWAGPVPREVLTNQAKILAIKSFDTYQENMGTALATHVINNLAPISRTVYTYQNTARLPENLTLKMHSFQAANEHLASMLGRDATTDELRDELGWTGSEINRIKDYNRKDLVESVGNINDGFFSTEEDADEALLAALYYDMLPNEKRLFELTTGYNGVRKRSSPEIMKELNISQAQLSYQKTQMKNKIQNYMNRSRNVFKQH